MVWIEFSTTMSSSHTAYLWPKKPMTWLPTPEKNDVPTASKTTFFGCHVKRRHLVQGTLIAPGECKTEFTKQWQKKCKQQKKGSSKQRLHSKIKTPKNPICVYVLGMFVTCFHHLFQENFQLASWCHGGNCTMPWRPGFRTTNDQLLEVCRDTNTSDCRCMLVNSECFAKMIPTSFSCVLSYGFWIKLSLWSVTLYIQLVTNHKAPW